MKTAQNRLKSVKTGDFCQFLNLSLCFVLFLLPLASMHAQEGKLQLNDEEYFEAPGVNVLAFNNWYNGLFGDSKISGIEVIHHGVRSVTNGDVRLNATPDQWEAIPTFVKREVDRENNRVDTYERYPEYDFDYILRAEAKGASVELSVITEKPLPAALVGKAGLNLEFIPSVYMERTYYMDGNSGLFPMYPSSDMVKYDDGYTAPKPFASGHKLILAPGDNENKITLTSTEGKLLLHDGRDKAQNGWYVVRSLLPEGKTGTILKWTLTPQPLNNWLRKPVIAHSQVGYHPDQDKVAVIELDKNDTSLGIASLTRITENGDSTIVKNAALQTWGRYTRYNYLLLTLPK